MEQRSLTEAYEKERQLTWDTTFSQNELSTSYQQLEQSL